MSPRLAGHLSAISTDLSAPGGCVARCLTCDWTTEGTQTAVVGACLDHHDETLARTMHPSRRRP